MRQGRLCHSSDNERGGKVVNSSKGVTSHDGNLP